MPVNNLLDDGQTKATAVLLCRKERLEDVGPSLFIHAAAVVAKDNPRYFGGATSIARRAANSARGRDQQLSRNSHRRLRFARIDSVGQEIRKHHAQLIF